MGENVVDALKNEQPRAAGRSRSLSEVWFESSLLQIVVQISAGYCAACGDLSSVVLAQ